MSRDQDDLDRARESLAKAAADFTPEGNITTEAVLIVAHQRPEDHGTTYSVLPMAPMAFHAMRGLIEVGLDFVLNDSVE